MTRLLPLFCLFLATSSIAGPSAALRWGVCDDGSALPTNQNFTGPGTFVQVVSARGLSGTVTGVSFEIRMKGAPDAWRFDAAGCNADNASFSLGSGSKTCPGVGNGYLVQQAVQYDPATQISRVQFVAAITAPVSLDPTKTYGIGRIGYDLTGSCSGSELPFCFELVSATYVDGNGEHPFELGNATVSWQDAQCLTTLFGGVRVDEFLPSCAAADTTAQFLELRSTGDFDRYSSHLRLRIEDHLNSVRYDAGDLFGTALEGQAWPRNRAWLLATVGFAGPADSRIPAALDPAGGRITLYDGRAGGAVVQVVDYGPPAPAGSSLVRQADESYASAVPGPENAAGEAIPFQCPLGNERIILRELALRCANGGNAGRFIELEATADQRFLSTTRLRVRDQDGILRQDVTGLFTPGQAEGALWPAGRSWLIGPPTLSGVTPDRVLALNLDDVAGSIELYGGPNGALIDRIEYGAAPPPGYSIERQADGSLSVDSTPTPRNFAGVVGGAGCMCPGPLCTDESIALQRIDEVALRCANGETTTQYVELRATGPGQAFHAGVRLKVLDHSGATRIDQDALFPGQAEGAPWAEGSAWLIAFGRRTGTDLADASGVAQDASMFEGLDPAGGTIILYDARAGGSTIHSIAYGPGGAIAAPGPGESLRRGPLDAPLIEAEQEPENHAGVHALVSACPCGASGLAAGSPMTWSTLPTRSLSGGGAYASYDLSTGAATAITSFADDRSDVSAADVYVLNGPIPGQAVTIRARLRVEGKFYKYCPPGWPYYCGGGFGRAGLSSEGTSVSRTYSDEMTDDLIVPIEVVTGQPFHLDWSVGASVDYESFGASAHLEGRLAFLDVPPGSYITSCGGFRTDGPTATLPGPLVARADDAGVHLEWSIDDGVTSAVVERTETGEVWEALGAPAITGNVARFDDQTAKPGARLGYRLSWGVGSTAVAWVDVPSARLALRALTANPGPAPTLEYVLPAPAPVRLELLDLRGRRVESREFGMQDAGPHRVDPRARLRPGVYWARLLVEGKEVRLKLVVL